MTPLDVIIELSNRITANRGAAVLISEEELSQWPAEAVQAMKEQKLITKARPGTSAVCSGCERECVMLVNTLPGEKGASASFIVCDKRNDINRVSVPPEQLTQWQCNTELLSGFIATSLGMRHSNRQTTRADLLEIGIASGKNHHQMLCLKADIVLTLIAGDKKIPLTEAIEFEKGRYFLDTEMICNLVDSAKTADDRYTPSNARREARKLETQAMYESWQKTYRNLKKTRPEMSDVWYSQQIEKMDIAQGRNSETIRKNMKK